MNQIVDLPPEDKILLDAYKCIESGRPLNRALGFEDITKLAALGEELKAAELEDKPKLEKIDALESKMEELRIKADTLRAQLNQKLLYIKQNPTTIKPIVPRATNGNSTINKESLMEVLRANPYGLGNAEVCKKLDVPNDKSNQNRVYNVMKALESEGKVKSENRMWKAL